MSSIFGGSKSSGSSESGNKAFGQISSAFSPMFGLAGQGGNALSALLGGDASGFNAFKGATGFSQLLSQGAQGILGSAAARGLLRSGSTGKALVNYGNTMQNQYADNYMGRLLGLSELGLGAGGLVTQAGQYSKSTQKSSSKPGIAKFIGAALAAPMTGGASLAAAAAS